MRKESYLYKKLDEKKVKCLTCNHKCIISNGKYGFCGVRKNINGKLYFMFYAQAVAENADPIEKKPFFEFLPKTKSLTIATVGCNFCCKWCQNWEISQITKTKDRTEAIKMGTELTPKRIIKDAFLSKCPSIAYSYTEPTIYLEYALDTMKIAKKAGLKNVWVSNGYMSDKTLDLILPYLDAINIDLKTFEDKKYCQFTNGKVKPILKNIKKIKKAKTHLEITTLVVPTFNDKKSELLKIAKFILDNLGPQTPWHITRYYPAYKMTVPPSPVELFHDIKAMAKNMGLKKVFFGNL